MRLQLAVARVVILRFDTEEEHRQLQQWELELRRKLKFRVLGLASLARSIARQRSRVLYLREGDANTRFFLLQACRRGRVNTISSLRVHGTEVINDDAMADALYEHYNAILGTNFVRSRALNLQLLGVPTEELSHLETLFSEDEVWAVIRELPNDKVPGPGLACHQTGSDERMNAVNTFWA